MNPSDLEVRYTEAGSVSALARQMGVSGGTVRYHLKKAGIPIRAAGFKSPKSKSRRGSEHHNWKGGMYRHAEGYIYEYAPDHPAASAAKGYVLQHRLVMERALGRLLQDNEIVHHVNEVKDDNRVENLEVTRRSEHNIHHKTDTKRDRLGRFQAG